MSAGRARTPSRAGASRARGRRAACRGGAAGPVRQGRRARAAARPRRPDRTRRRRGRAPGSRGRAGSRPGRRGAQLACRLQGRTCDHRSGDHDTGSDSCPYGEGVVDRGQRGARLVSRADCAEGVILMERRDAEHCQHVGSRRLLDGASVALDSRRTAAVARCSSARSTSGSRPAGASTATSVAVTLLRTSLGGVAGAGVTAGGAAGGSRRLGVLEQDPLMETLQLLARLDPVVDEQSPRC